MVSSHKLAREIVSLGSESWHVSTPIRNRRKYKIDGELKIRIDRSGELRSLTVSLPTYHKSRQYPIFIIWIVIVF